MKCNRARMNYHSGLLAGIMAGLLLCAAAPVWAQATTSVSSTSGLYPGFFRLQTPGSFNLTLFGGGFGSDKYGTLQEGVQFEQSVTKYISAVGRISGYQLFEGEGFDNPLDPGTGHSARLNFARFQGGVDMLVTPAMHFFLLGGGDAGDSHAADIEGDLSTWLMAHTMHPLSVLLTGGHNFQNDVTSSSIDLRAVVLSTEDYMLLAGAGGAIYGGGFVTDVSGEGGPDLGVYYRPWQMGVDIQAGYGSAHQYGQVAFYKQFSFPE